MVRRFWEGLPALIRAAIEGEVGSVRRVVSPGAGRNSDFSAVLHLAEGMVFCKGIEIDGKRGAMHRHEAGINAWLPTTITPRLRWHTEVGGWLLLGFDHVPGRHADLSPGSADLPGIAELATTLTTELARCPAQAPRLAQQWARLAAWRRLAEDGLDPWAREHLDELIHWELRAIELVNGDDLVHTDLHPLNILVSDTGPKAVDWAWSRKATAAVDIAFLVPRLVHAGHSPAEAERWAETIPAWSATDEPTRTAFAVAIWGIWELLARDNPLPHRAALTAAAGRWARWRLEAPACGDHHR
ncbi:phosphotransferase family protein [Actinokineospora sp. NPDC004072]